MRFKITIPNMSCQHCYQKIQKALTIPGVNTFEMDIPSKKGTLSFDDTIVNQESLTQSVADIGYHLDWGDQIE